ncbi:MAG: methyltransferase domain-containing protein [Syntrophobacterales bacterium]|jgi:tRNA1Val (adenine37-N6)-methyltransferase|nr:methyltransferase domain-containing protein [Syntrophobacterales bacterium]
MPETAWADETLDFLCGEDLRIVQKKRGYRFSIDAILLANFVILKKNERLLDIGTGCGIIPVYMTRMGLQNSMIGIELQLGLFQAAVKNREINNCGNIQFLQGDIRTEAQVLRDARIDVIVSNPPYTKRGSGRKSPDDSRYVARYETELDLPLLLSFSSSLLQRKGRLYVIYPVKRLAELIYSAKSQRLELKRVRFVQPRRGEKPNLFLAELLKEGGVGTIVEKPLCIYDNGNYTEEVKSYYSLKGPAWKALQD